MSLHRYNKVVIIIYRHSTKMHKTSAWDLHKLLETSFLVFIFNAKKKKCLFVNAKKWFPSSFYQNSQCHGRGKDGLENGVARLKAVADAGDHSKLVAPVGHRETVSLHDELVVDGVPCRQHLTLAHFHIKQRKVKFSPLCCCLLPVSSCV